MDYYKLPAKDVLRELASDEKGLSTKEARLRLQRHGYNKIEEKDKISPIRIFFSQFSSPLMWILVAAVIASIFIGEKTDAIVIGIVIVLNSAIGFAQEYKAEKAIEALKSIASLKAVAIREGFEREIDAREIVPGDIIVLSTGEKVPADARLIEAINLQTQEGALTGESLPVAKDTEAIKNNAGLADRKNMVFSGTIITNGRGKAIVTETGMKTEVGKIAHLIQTTKTDLTPLQKQLKHVVRWLGILVVVICALVFAMGVIKAGAYDSKALLNFFMVAVSLAVAAVPEGMPAVVTLSLALGIKRMAKRNALIRKLPSVETLGSTTVICTDKTGTLTHNEMTVKKIYVDDTVVEASGSGYETRGYFSQHTKTLPMLLRIGALNNDARLEEKEGRWQVIGDPTEGALLVSAAKLGLDYELLSNKFRRIDEVQFDASRKRMATVHEFHGKRFCFVKGAPDVMINLCTHIEENGRIRRMTRNDVDKAMKINNYFAENALRVLGFAYRELGGNDKKGSYEKNLVFVGMQGMIDPPRKEAKDAVARCERAGIKVVMITGDFKGTAVAIAKELGIQGKAVTGEELDRIDLDSAVSEIGIYARVNPEHKLKIVAALKKKGHVVAMTGDGINDAPAMKKADIGIGMGITGTDVAKEASEMILTDDNFASIVNAVEEGRGIYDNIRKFVNVLLSSNIGEVLVIFFAMLVGWPLPLIAIQILWVNLITDGAPALALGVDPVSPGIMERKPRKAADRIMSGKMFLTVVLIGILISIATLMVFRHGLNTDETTARTAAFTTLVFLEIVRVQMVRSRYKIGLFSNGYLLLALASSIMLQLAVVYTPLNAVFKTVPLPMAQLGYIAAVIAGVFVVGSIITRIIGGSEGERY